MESWQNQNGRIDRTAERIEIGFLSDLSIAYVNGPAPIKLKQMIGKPLHFATIKDWLPFVCPNTEWSRPVRSDDSTTESNFKDLVDYVWILPPKGSKAQSTAHCLFWGDLNNRQIVRNGIVGGTGKGGLGFFGIEMGNYIHKIGHSPYSD
jgi:hypothetical protein